MNTRIKHISAIFLTIISLYNCSSKKEGNVTITGTILGLKKGVIYLQKIQDTVLINIDSLEIKGDPKFSFTTSVTEPEIHYLYLDKHDGTPYNDRISFFAEKGTVNIQTTFNGFERDAWITGGKNQEKLRDYQKMSKRFDDRNLRLLKEDYEARKQKDEEKLLENDKAYKKLLKQKYLYTINFALLNRKLEVAPYLTLNEVFDANITYLDTIARSLSPRVKKSIYGKQFLEFLEERRKEESHKSKLEDSIIPLK